MALRDVADIRVTPYGRRVLGSAKYERYDPTAYVAALKQRIGLVDATVLAYVEESLETFTRGNTVAAMVMLGVAAEWVFNRRSQSLESSLNSAAETQKLRTLLSGYAMKPKVDGLTRSCKR